MDSPHQQFLKRRDSLIEPSYFSGVDHSFAQIHEILSKPSHQRTDQQLKVLTHFTRNIKMFAAPQSVISAEVHIECCRYMTYEMHPAATVSITQILFHAGDEGSKFYMILAGSCAVLAPARRTKPDVSQLAVLRQGESFGELALISNRPRAASVLCREETHLAVLQRNDYLRVLGRTHNLLLTEKVELLHRHPVFGSWAKCDIQRLSYFFKDRLYRRKQVLFRAGNDPTEVFIVKSGEFQLSKDISYSQKTATTGREEGDSGHCQVDVTIISTGEMIGAEEAFKLLKHKYTCSCHSTTGEVLVISQEDFRCRISNERTIFYLQNMTKVKETYRLERVTQASELVKREKKLEQGGITHRSVGLEEGSYSKTLRDALLQKKINLSPKRAFDSSQPPQQSSQILIKPALPRLHNHRSLSVLYFPTSASSLQIIQMTARVTRPCQKIVQSVSPFTRTWGEIMESKFPLEKTKPAPQKRLQSVVNFHTQLQRQLNNKQSAATHRHSQSHLRERNSATVISFDGKLMGSPEEPAKKTRRPNSDLS